jgi:hypothetical protein
MSREHRCARWVFVAFNRRNRREARQTNAPCYGVSRWQESPRCSVLRRVDEADASTYPLSRVCILRRFGVAYPRPAAKVPHKVSFGSGTTARADAIATAVLGCRTECRAEMRGVPRSARGARGPLPESDLISRGNAPRAGVPGQRMRRGRLGTPRPAARTSRPLECRRPRRWSGPAGLRSPHRPPTCEAQR